VPAPHSVSPAPFSSDSLSEQCEACVVFPSHRCRPRRAPPPDIAESDVVYRLSLTEVDTVSSLFMISVFFRR